jgi:hypothetical protein
VITILFYRLFTGTFITITIASAITFTFARSTLVKKFFRHDSLLKNNFLGYLDNKYLMGIIQERKEKSKVATLLLMS